MPTLVGRHRRLTGHEQLRNKQDVSSCRPEGFVFSVCLHFMRSGISMPTASGVVVEKESEYILAHSRTRELDGRPHWGLWVGVVSR